MAVGRDNALGTTYAALIVLALFSSLEAQILTVNSCSGGINGNLDAQTTMAPQNLGNVPYAAQISNQIYTPGSSITVTCQPLTRPAIQYQEIIIQARLASEPVDTPSIPVGTFTFVNEQPIANNPDFAILNCNNGVFGSTVATTNASTKRIPRTGLTFTYQTPNPAVGAIRFVATIVQNPTTIYERITTQAFDEVSTGGQGPAIFSCPGNIVETSDDADESAIVSWGEPNSTGIPDASNRRFPIDEFPVDSLTTVIYQYSRGVFTNQCIFDVLVVNLTNDPPQFESCPVDIQVAGGPENQVMYDYVPPSCTDPNGEETSVSCDPSPSMPVPVVAQIECTCTDAGGLTDACIIPAPADFCNPNPCQNGGTCIKVPQLQSGFVCLCPTGFDQPLCDNNPPDTPNCPGPQTARAPAGSNSVSVQYNPVQCNDIEDGVFLASCLPPSGFQFGIDTTAVVCSCTDSGGLVSSCSFTVTVTVRDVCNPNPCQNGGVCITVPQFDSGFICQCPDGFEQPICNDPDNNAPVANCPGDQRATAPEGSNSVSVDYGSGQCSDIEDGVFLASCFPASGSQFGIETTAVVCTCVDSGGLVSSCSFTVTVTPAGIPGGVCDGNPCSGNECRLATNSLAGYTCHRVVGTPCL